MTQLKVRKDLIYSACSSYIHAFMKKRGDEFKKTVKYYMLKQPGFFSRVFLKKQKMTFKEAAIYAKIYGTEPDFWLTKPWKYWYETSIQDARNLIKACEIDCENYVMLSTDDAAFVNKWCNKGNKC
ncbi:MAG: hypothetical protein WC055_00910 [Melioribacteraceae bacterium]